jgi:hypothetical protein
MSSLPDPVHPDPALLVVAAIRHTSLCQACITRKTGLAWAQVLIALAQIARAMGRIGIGQARCEMCESARPLYRVA